MLLSLSHTIISKYCQTLKIHK